MESAFATAMLVPLASQDPDQMLVVAVDTVVDALVEWADELGRNPACMAEAAFNALHERLSPPERLVLLAVEQTLMADDPTGEAGTPHETCSPWPEEAAVSSLATAGGGQVLRLALGAAGQTHGMEENPGLVVSTTTPGILVHLALAWSAGSSERLREIVDRRSGA